MQGVTFTDVDYQGRKFDRFYASRSDLGPGWFVYGRNPGYGDRLISLCAWPDRPPRRHLHWNGKVRHGWRLRRDAQAIADRLNTGER